MDDLNANKGWECPKCGTVNAPWKPQCDCKSRPRTFNVQATCAKYGSVKDKVNNTWRCPKGCDEIG